MFAREKTTDDAFGGIDRLEFLTLSLVPGVSEKKDAVRTREGADEISLSRIFAS